MIAAEDLEADEREEWSENVGSRLDFEALLAWASASLPAVAVACTCCDESCVRCRAAAVVDRLA